MSQAKDFKHYSSRSIRSFVVRSGKFTKGQESSYKKLAGQYCLPFTNFGGDIEACKKFWHPYTSGKEQFLCEIGFGSGSATQQLVQQLPNTFYLGIEVYKAGIARLMQKCEEASLQNLRIVEHDAIEVFEQMLPPASLDGLHIFFPDPWPKKRHQKRRIVSENTLDSFWKVLKVGGYLYFVSDWQEYAQKVGKLLSTPSWNLGASELGSNASQLNLRQIARPIERPKSRFEQKALCEGREIYELFALKTASASSSAQSK